MQVETMIEPPDLPEWPGDEDDDEETVDALVTIRETDGTGRAAYVSVRAGADDATVANALVEGVLGSAAMRGPALVAAVRNRMSREVTE